MKRNLKITLLGTGSSGGVPRVGGDWGACDPNEPKNRRTRCSLALEYWEGDTKVAPNERTIVLIDTSPDLREQLLAANIDHIDALFYTHDHADQVHGIDDIRAIAYRYGKRVPTYMNAFTKDILLQRFGYCFKQPKGRIHPPILELMPLIKKGSEVEINGPGGKFDIKAIEVSHGNYDVLGFTVFDKVAYTPDVHNISADTLNALYGLDLWIVDALRYHAHPTHAHIDRTLSWAAKTKTRKIILTNLHIDMDYQTLSQAMPGAHIVGYDGLSFTYVFR